MAGIDDTVKDDWQRGQMLTAEWANSVGRNINQQTQFGKGAIDYMLANAAGAFPGNQENNGIFFYNGDGSNSIPAYGVALRNGSKTVGGGVCPQTKQPDQYAGQYPIVNGGSAVAANGYGFGQFLWNDVLILAYDSTTGTPSAGDMWGIGNGSYLLKKGYAGFIVDGIYDSTNHWLLGRWMQPTTVRGKPTPSQVPSGSSSAVNVYVGAYGSETQPTGNPQIQNVRNDSSCTVQVKICTIRYNPDNGLYQFTDAYTQ